MMGAAFLVRLRAGTGSLCCLGGGVLVERFSCGSLKLGGRGECVTGMLRDGLHLRGHGLKQQLP